MTGIVLGNIESLGSVLPEIFLSIYLFALILVRLVQRSIEEHVRLYYVLGALCLGLTLALEIVANAGAATMPVSLFNGVLTLDAFSHYFKLLCLLSALFFVLFAMNSRETTGLSLPVMEYVLLILSSTLGMMLLSGSTNLLMMYLSLELLSYTSYLITGFIDRDERVTEASVKYLLYGGIASGVMIYGLSILYGAAGSLDYAALHSTLQSGSGSALVVNVAVVMVLAGVGFKIAAVPFHLWCPDVYEGAPTPFTAFLSVGPKAAGFAMALRFFYQIFLSPGEGSILAVAEGLDWTMPLAAMAALTMTLGNLAALHQRNLKRLLAYSSIAHAGYMLMAVASRTSMGVTAVFFYLAVYLLMNLGAFLVVMIIYDEYHSDTIDIYEGLAWRSPRGAFLASMFTVYLFSLTGIPPFAGFIGKVYLLLAVFERGSVLYWLAVVAVVNTVISLYYYARIIKLMFLSRKKPDIVLPGITRGRYFQYAVLGGFAFLTIALGVYWEPLHRIGVLAADIIIR